MSSYQKDPSDYSSKRLLVLPTTFKKIKPRNDEHSSSASTHKKMITLVLQSLISNQAATKALAVVNGGTETDIAIDDLQEEGKYPVMPTKDALEGLQKAPREAALSSFDIEVRIYDNTRHINKTILKERDDMYELYNFLVSMFVPKAWDEFQTVYGHQAMSGTDCNPYLLIRDMMLFLEPDSEKCDKLKFHGLVEIFFAQGLSGSSTITKAHEESIHIVESMARFKAIVDTWTADSPAAKEHAVFFWMKGLDVETHGDYIRSVMLRLSSSNPALKFPDTIAKMLIEIKAFDQANIASGNGARVGTLKKNVGKAIPTGSAGKKNLQEIKKRGRSEGPTNPSNIRKKPARRKSKLLDWK